MNVIKTQLIQTTGVLAVTVTGTAGYVGRPTSITASWTPNAFSYVVVDWGDGTIDTGGDLQYWSPYTSSHSYATAGSKTVTVTVADPLTGAGGVATFGPFNVAALLTSTFTANPTGGKIPLAVTFTFQIAGGFPNYTWTLNYGDGTTSGSGSAVVNPPLITNVHTYAKVGSFTATLTVTDAYGTVFSAPLGVSGLLEGESTVVENLMVIGGLTLAAALVGKGVSKKGKKNLALPFGLGGAVLGLAVQRLRGRL